MKEYPILLTTEMVKATLDGRKTHTRRISGKQLRDINKNPHWYDSVKEMCVNKKGKTIFAFKKKEHWIDNKNDYATKVDYADCPYGKIGDRLWVRETFSISDDGEGRPMVVYKTTDKKSDIDKWKPSIFMPRNASRITLEITDIRVERVQDISIVDCINEGISEDFLNSAILQFKILWDSINLKRGYGWNSNPKVRVIEFKQLEAKRC